MNFDKVPEIDHSHPRRWARARRFLGPVVVVAAAAALGLGAWELNRLRSSAARAERQAGIEDLEKRLEDCERRLAAAGSEPEAQLDVLEEGVVLLRELAGHQGDRAAARNQQLEDWQRRVDDLHADVWLARSRAAEAAADEALARGDAAAAAAGYREASRLQRRVNNSGASALHVSYARETMLAQQAERVVLEPRAREVQAEMAAAEVAEKGGAAEAALAHYRRARELQVALNRDFPDSAYANRAEVERLDTLIASLLAVELDAQVTAGLAQARAAAAAGNPGEAERWLEAAEAAQRRIHEEFGRSRFHSPERLMEIEIERQTVQVTPRIRELHEIVERIDAHLRRREVPAARELLPAAARLVEEIGAAAPRARGLDDAFRRRVDFLLLAGDGLAAVQERVRAALRPLPGRPDAAMLATEVPQALFSELMRNNPSRQAGPELPADSVTRAEAVEFCRRLGWILGAPVRLPTVAELTRAAEQPGRIWSAENSQGRSQPVGAGPRAPAEFSDVLGNLAEWVDGAPDADGLAEIAGGSFLTPIAAMRGLPVERVPVGGRDRRVGFRVVVESAEWRAR